MLNKQITSSVDLTKSKIRSKMLLRLKKQKEEDRERKSSAIKEKLFGTVEFIKARTVMFYISFGGEVKTRKMISDAQKLGKKIAIPVCDKAGGLRPCLYHKGLRLVIGPYGVHEPVEKKAISLEDLDLVIVPGLAFEKNGKRLGRGKAYYDHFLAKLGKRAPAISLAYDFQILPSVPTSPTDIDVDRIIFA
jgi:5-formyltetrahydrofolate cyclo-ligase